MIKTFLPALWVVVLLMTSIPLPGQSPYCRQYATEHGLPSMETYQVRIDGKGYVWVATDRGLCRFNGSEFVTFNQKDGLKDLTVFNIREDDQGRMWAASFSKTLFYFEDGRFHPFPHNDILKDLIHNTVIDDMVIAGDTIWISVGRMGLLKMTMAGDWEWIQDDSAGTHFAIFGNQEPLFWTNPSPNYHTVSVSSPKGEQRYTLPGGIDAGRFSKTSILALSNGDIMIASFGALHVLHPNRELTQLLCQFPSTNAAIYEDQQGAVWVGSLRAGVRKFDLHHGYAQQGHYLQDYSISFIAGDPEGGIWMTTLEAGVQYLPTPNILNFQPGVHRNHPKYIDMLQCQNRLFFSSNNGDLHEVRQTKDHVWAIRTLGPPSELAGTNTLGCFQEQLYFNVAGTVSRLEEGQLHPLDDELGLLVATEQTLFTVNSRLRRYTPEWQGDTLIDFTPFTIREALIDAQETIWLGRLTGLSYYRAGQLVHLDSLGPAFRSRVTDLATGDRILVATLGYGVICLDPTTLSFSLLDEDHGLPDNNTSAVYQQQNGDVWVGTTKGLCHLQPQDNGTYRVVKTFTAQDGILKGEVQKILEFEDAIWVLHQDGLSSIPLQSQYRNRLSPPIRITNAWLTGSASKPLENDETLPYTQNDLAISFEGIAYRNAFDMKYRYRLLGLDSAFRSTSDPRVQFNALEPGAYTFEVLAVNGDGLTSQSAAQFSFVIRPPFWLRAWFLILVLAVLLGLVTLFILIRDRIKSRQIKLELEVLENEQKAVTAQINPHFIYNAMNSIQYFVLENRPEVAADYLAKSSQLMRMVLANTRKRFIPLSDELTILQLYLSLEKERFEDKFEYQLEIEEGLALDKILIPSMVLQPHIENAIWHGLLKKTEGIRILHIHLHSEKEHLVWTIQDNGIGRKASLASGAQPRGHTSSGIDLTRRRLELLNRQGKGTYKLEITDLQDGQGLASGTLVRVTLFQKLQP